MLPIVFFIDSVDENYRNSVEYCLTGRQAVLAPRLHTGGPLKMRIRVLGFKNLKSLPAYPHPYSLEGRL